MYLCVNLRYLMCRCQRWCWLSMGDDMKTDAMLAKELNQVIQDRRALEKREAELKDFFKTRMSAMGTDTLSVGGILVSMVSKARSGLDAKALTVALGEDKIAEFQKVTEYVQVDVKQEDVACDRLAA